MKLRNKIMLGAALAMVAMQTTRAAIYLSDLTGADGRSNGSEITVGDKTFSGFSYQASGLTGFDASQITVSAYIGADGVYYLSWGGSIALVSGGPAIADLLLGYTVTANPGQIVGIDQSYVGSGTPLGGTFLAVDETVNAGAVTVGYSHLERGDLSDPPGETIQGDMLVIDPPQSTLTVTKDISLAINSFSGGLVSISEVTQSFHQVPEASTMIAGALLLLPLGASTLRILRRNRMP
ncbi:MAG TPA: hypothetical protein VMB80_11105 [Candidatus Acidoferrum sp.]|nr:hypothetical protein [Candidatus Acidoferrum sp.]